MMLYVGKWNQLSPVVLEVLKGAYPVIHCELLMPLSDASTGQRKFTRFVYSLID